MSQRQLHMARISSPRHLLGAITMTMRPRATQTICQSRQWLAEVRSCLQQLSGDSRQHDSGACTHGHRSWALCCTEEHAARGDRHTVLSCVCERVWPRHAKRTPIRHRGMCEWNSEARRWHLARTHKLAAASLGGTHNLVAAFWAGSRHQHVAAFPWGTRHLAAAAAYGTHKLATALAGANHNHDAPARNAKHIPIAAVAGRTQKLPAAAFWRTVGSTIPEHARMDTDRGPSVASRSMLRAAIATPC